MTNVGGEGREGVDGDVDSSENESKLAGQAEVLLEDEGSKVDDGVGSSLCALPNRNMSKLLRLQSTKRRETYDLLHDL